MMDDDLDNPKVRWIKMDQSQSSNFLTATDNIPVKPSTTTDHVGPLGEALSQLLATEKSSQKDGENLNLGFFAVDAAHEKNGFFGPKNSHPIVVGQAQDQEEINRNQGIFALPKASFKSRSSRQRSKSVSQVQHTETPLKASSTVLVKPSPTAFLSTGVISKKGRGSMGAMRSKVTPETPVKHKRVLGSIWSGSAPVCLNENYTSSGVHNQPSHLESVNESVPSTPNTPRSIATPFNARVATPTFLRSSSNFASPSYTRNSYTPSIHTSSKSYQLQQRSPLKETPTKSVKRPHQALEGDSPNQPLFINIHQLLPPSKVDEPRLDDENITSDDSPNPAHHQHSQEPHSFLDTNNLPMQPPSQVFPLQAKKDRAKGTRLFAIERKVAAPEPKNPIPFQSLVSRHRHHIDDVFFDAIDGIEPGLSLTLSLFSNRPNEVGNQRSRDWFESQFELIGRLGRGAFATAFHVQSVVDGLEYAIKRTIHPFTGFNDAMSKLNEVRMLLKVKNNPYCVSIKDAWIQFGYVYIQTELCSRGNLSSYLEQYCSETPLTEEQIWRILTDIVQGLFHIHQQGIMHLDIKPGNIFITHDGTLKIGDFGLASRPPIKNSDLEGDRTYLAPEFLTSTPVSYPADIFSLGLILLEMAANIVLPENGLVWQQLREGNIESIGIQRHSQMLIDFIKSMLNGSPDLRPTAQDLLAHPKLVQFCRPANN